MRRDRAPDHVVRDAGALAEATDDFYRAVERGESSESLSIAFDRVAEHYHHLREYYDDRSRDGDRYDERYGYRESDERRRFDAVTTAYLEAEGAFRHRNTRHG